MMRRTPKNYDGIESPAKLIGELLPEIVGRIQLKGSADLIEAWPKIIGAKMAPLTRAVSFENGVLAVLVQSSTLYSLLCTHEKPRLLGLIRQQFPKTQVRDIAFRIG